MTRDCVQERRSTSIEAHSYKIVNNKEVPPRSEPGELTRGGRFLLALPPERDAAFTQ